MSLRKKGLQAHHFSTKIPPCPLKIFVISAPHLLSEILTPWGESGCARKPLRLVAMPERFVRTFQGRRIEDTIRQQWIGMLALTKYCDQVLLVLSYRVAQLSHDDAARSAQPRLLAVNDDLDSESAKFS
jgi:hypothetical protein